MPSDITAAEWDEIFDEMRRENEMVKCLKTRPRLSTKTVRRIYAQEVPDGFHLHHICGNRWCGNAEHLIAVSAQDHSKLHRKESFCA